MQTVSDRGRRRRKLRNAGLAILLCVVVAPIALELALRFLLFSDTALARRWGTSLRKPALYADGECDDEFWKLEWLFADPARRIPALNPDPVCGWTGYAVRPGTYEQVFAPELAGRTPVLLYGDSFAECITPPEQCFQGLMSESELADRYALVNYGVGGYGTDQIYLLIQQSIDRWRALDPIVVVGILVDSDLDRSVLSLRGWPKPRLVQAGDRLVLDGPVAPDVETYLRERPLAIRSYLLRRIVHGAGFLPTRWRTAIRESWSRREEKIAINRRILEEIHRELASRGLRHFFLMFQGQRSLRRDPSHEWAEELVREMGRELGVPVMPTRPYLVAAGGGKARGAERFFGQSGPYAAHYDELGNLAVFEAIRAGIEGRFDPPDTSRVEAMRADGRFEAGRMHLLGFEARTHVDGELALVRVGTQAYPPFDVAAIGGEVAPYLVLRPGLGGSAQVAFYVNGRARLLRGFATGLRAPDLESGVESRSEPLRLTVRVDGRMLSSTPVPIHPDGFEIDVDLAGVSKLELVAEGAGPGPLPAWIHVKDVRIE